MRIPQSISETRLGDDVSKVISLDERGEATESVCSLEETVSGSHVCCQDGTKNSRTWKDREQWREKLCRFGESMKEKNGIQLCRQAEGPSTQG